MAAVMRLLLRRPLHGAVRGDGWGVTESAVLQGGIGGYREYSGYRSTAGYRGYVAMVRT